MPFDTEANAATLYRSPNAAMLVVDTSTEAGRIYMRDLFKARREAAALLTPRAKVRAALTRYRSAQARAAKAVQWGYEPLSFGLTVAECRAEVRAAIARLRLAMVDLKAAA